MTQESIKSRREYRKKSGSHITAVQLDLDFEQFSFHKWGGEQQAKPGDWLVDNHGDIYTVDKDYFRTHYEKISQGLYEKVGAVWALEADEDGEICTQEGKSNYKKGDFLVFDRAEGGDGYAIHKTKFERMYELVTPPNQLTVHQLEYIKELNQQIQSYDAQANFNRTSYYIVQSLAIIFAASVPVITAFTSFNAALTAAVVAICGGLSAVLAGVLGLFNWQQNWVCYHRSCEDLKSHLAQFKVGAGSYANRENAFFLLVDNCERMLADQRGLWASLMTSADIDEETPKPS